MSLLIVISPAKTLDFSASIMDVPRTAPAFPAETAALAKKARTLKARDLKKLMGISDKLAELNVQRFADFREDADPQGAKQAVLAFKGDVYQGMDAASLTHEDLLWAQDHLRILSGFYGLLRPLDAMQPYRLEMGTSLKVGRKKDLYAFWGDKIAQALNAVGPQTLINLASNEYFSAVDQKALQLPIVTPVFKEVRDGKARVFAFNAKRARGMMSRWIIENRIEDPAELRTFNVAGYRFVADTSDDSTFEFHRDNPAS